MKLITWLLALTMLLIAGGCKEGKKGENLLPNPLGTAGDILVVLETGGGEVDTLWSTIQTVLAAEYPYLPQPEPTFTLVKMPPKLFTGVRGYRNILILKIDKAVFPASKMLLRYDVWASPQLVVTVVGPSPAEIAAYILKERERIVAIFEQAERDRQMVIYNRLPDQKIQLLLKQKFGISLSLPNGYKINRKADDFVWLSYETPFTSLGIMVYTYPYKSDSTFTKNYLIAKRNAYTQKYIPGPSKGSYMITGHFYEPAVTPTMFKDRYFAILRGLWEVKNDYMGGPFISFTTLDEKNNRVITVEGYVYAPKDEKRNYLRQVESVLYSFKLVGNIEKKEKK